MLISFLKSKNNVLLPAILLLAFFSNYTGQSAPYLSYISPYYSAAIDLEDRAFLRMADERLNGKREIENQIIKVASKFRTGLKSKNLRLVAGWIMEESQKYGYDPLFLTALIVTESSFYNWAKSRRGALGLMQIRPRTGYAMASETHVPWKGKKTLYDPGVNIALGAYYLNKLAQHFDGDISLALEAYNHGPTKLKRYLRRGVRPVDYSRKVFENYDKILSSSI
ncbi:MAG: lytic transglycosylase domain-containing protein [Nitrospinales bacterium]